MSDYDPNRIDPKRPAVNEAGYAADRGFNWNWIIGGIAALVVLVVALSFMGRDDRTADTATPPAATTGQSTPAPTSTAPTPAPATPNAMPADRTAPPRPASPNQ
jgi:type IV secretory pathway VirB10-like protein